MITTGNPTSNSFTIYVQDAIGDHYCQSSCANRPQILASAKAHARWWVNTMKRPTPRARLARQPCYPCTIVVEFYHDASAVLPWPRRRKSA